MNDSQYHDSIARQLAVAQAIDHLRKARDLLHRAGAPRSLERVRRALSSAEGARRHATGLAVRTSTNHPLADAVPIGSPGRLVSLDGRRITAAFEVVAGYCHIEYAVRQPDHSLVISDDGEGTNVADWSAEPMIEAGQRVFMVERGPNVLEAAIRLIPL